MNTDIAPETIDSYKLIQAVFLKGYEEGLRDAWSRQPTPTDVDYLQTVTTEIMSLSFELTMKLIKEHNNG